MRIASWYHARSARDRAVLRALALVVLVALLAVAGLEAARTRARLAQELPALRASIATLESQAAEVRRLRALPARAQASAAPLASLATNAGGLAGAEVRVLDDRRVAVRGGDIAFTALLEWLGHARATHGMAVESARLEALPAPGRVRAELVLARS